MRTNKVYRHQLCRQIPKQAIAELVKSKQPLQTGLIENAVTYPFPAAIRCAFCVVCITFILAYSITALSDRKAWPRQGDTRYELTCHLTMREHSERISPLFCFCVTFQNDSEQLIMGTTVSKTALKADIAGATDVALFSRACNTCDVYLCDLCGIHPFRPIFFLPIFVSPQASHIAPNATSPRFAL